MKIIAPALVAIIAAAALSGPANAQFSTFTFGVNGTQAQLQARIREGMRNGSLTRSEVRQLQSKLSQIQAMESRFSYNGLSQRERNRLNAHLAKLSSDIDRQMNDLQRRNSNRGNHFGYGYGYGRDRDRGWHGDRGHWTY